MLDVGLRLCPLFARETAKRSAALCVSFDSGNASGFDRQAAEEN